MGIWGILEGSWGAEVRSKLLRNRGLRLRAYGSFGGLLCLKGFGFRGFGLRVEGLGFRGVLGFDASLQCPGSGVEGVGLVADKMSLAIKVSCCVVSCPKMSGVLGYTYSLHCSSFFWLTKISIIGS